MVTPAKQKKRVSFKLAEDDNEDLSEEKSDKSIIISEESKQESVKKKELNRNDDDSNEDIKLCSNKGKTASLPLNNSDNSVTKSCKTKEDRASDVRITSDLRKNSNRRDTRGLMAVREVKMAAQAYRGANINNVKGYSGMRITPVDVKRKLNNVK
ncbi:uncharacterized protein LOC132744909 [Ruditapes philippinarum]|uniref:uncharacterized protein LOC132744909 n=1 Tax=Ruditapes philippinarum TaxID=129788 RepID=UPI00295C1098|nr:uncharacterized protein LOC132744909 [Ruditapes philippinarum]